MERKPKILAFAGSMREGSVNKKLIKIAVGGTRKAGCETTLIDIADFRMPLYDGDLEEREGIPQIARDLKKIMMEHDGLMIASPEYNSSIPGVLKNLIDWVSRPEEGEKTDLPAFRGKVVSIMSASPSGWGGLRGLVTLRSMLENIHCMVLPQQVTVAKAYEAFTPDGQLKDVATEQRVFAQGKALVDVLTKLKG